MRQKWAREASWTPWWLPGSFCPGAASGVDTALVEGLPPCFVARLCLFSPLPLAQVGLASAARLGLWVLPCATRCVWM